MIDYLKTSDGSLSPTANLQRVFSSFLRNLAVTNSSEILTSYKNVLTRLNKDFYDIVSDSSHGLLVGSFGRGTAIDGVSDVDMIFQMPYSYYQKFNAYSGNKQSAFLQDVRESILRRYPNTKVSADGQVVVIPFSDKINFEIVPAFINEGGESYTYPDTNDGGSWKVCYPRKEQLALKSLDLQVNGNLVNLAKMIRAWNEYCDVGVSGILIDTFAYLFLSTYAHSAKGFVYYDWLVRDFFSWLSDRPKNVSSYRIPGSNSNISTDNSFQMKAKRAYMSCSSAVEYNYQNSFIRAASEWNTVFGKAFE